MERKFKALGGLWKSVRCHKFEIREDEVIATNNRRTKNYGVWCGIGDVRTFEALRAYTEAHEILEKDERESRLGINTSLLTRVSETNDELPRDMRIRHQFPYNFSNDMAEIRIEVSGDL